MLGQLIGALFKALFEVIGDALVDILSTPDALKPDPEPVLDRMVYPDPDELVNRYGGLT